MKTSYTEGPILKPLLIMMLATWVAMAANMMLTLVDMFFLSRLNDLDVLAAMGFSTAIAMFAGSLGVGLSVATSVLVSQKLSKSGRDQASQLFTATLLVGLILAVVIAVTLIVALPWLLSMLGAEHRVLTLAQSYLTIALASAPLAVASMIFGSGLRAAAMAKASMWLALVATVLNMVLDPIFIELLDWGIEGAAWATVIARVTAFAVGLYFFAAKLNWIRAIDRAALSGELPAIRRIAMPVLISNLLTPVGGLIVVAIIADYGSAAMAGMAVVGSLTPILFSVFFSLTGAAGPMIGQNVGAEKPLRIARIYRTGLLIIGGYSLLIWGLAVLAIPVLQGLFQIDGQAAELLAVYCTFQIPLTAGLGLLALSNGIFNNLGKPRWSMYLNACRATLATWVLCMLGSHFYGLYGAVIGASLSFLLFGTAAVALAARLFARQYPGQRLLREPA